jgi:hypothetical protein
VQFKSWKELLRNSLSSNSKTRESVEKFQDSNLPPGPASTRENMTYNDDGTIMLFPPNKIGSRFVLSKQNPNNLKNVTTNTHNSFAKKKDRNIEFWKAFSGEITYRSTGQNGRTCRLDVFASTLKQTNNWKTAIHKDFIGNENDLKNQEVTIIMRANNRIGSKNGCSIKMRGGGHHKDSPDQAACIGLETSTRDSGHTARWAKELSHPIYEYQELRPFFEFFVEDGRWFGMKTTSWNNLDKTTTNRCYIDPDPFGSDGTLRNNYRLYSEYIDKGNGNKYPKIIANWAGGVPTTIRVDGFESIDFYACSAIEIISPVY